MNTYNIDKIKELAQEGKAIITQRASTEAQNEFGFDFQDILNEIMSLTALDFHRSDISDKKDIYFDVYKKRVYSEAYKKHFLAYIKLRINGDLSIISFHTT